MGGVIKLYAAIVSFLYAISLSVVLIVEGVNNIQALSNFLYDNKVHMLILGIASGLYIIFLLFRNFKVIFNLVKQSSKTSDKVTFILTIIGLIGFGYILILVFIAIFSAFYGYSTKKMSFLFYVLYYATFIGFTFSLRDLLEAFKDKSTKMYKGRYIIFLLVMLGAYMLANFFDEGTLQRGVVETVFTCISSIILILTISISSYLAYRRELEKLKKMEYEKVEE